MKFKFSFCNNVNESNKFINVFCFNNKKVFDILFNKLLKETDDILKISLDEPLKPNKEFIIFTDPFSLDINDKKILQFFYDEEDKNISLENEKKILKINQDILEVLFDVENSSFYDFEYLETISLKDILSFMKVKLIYDKDFFSYFKKYLNVYVFLFKTKCFVTFDFLNLFNEAQLNELNDFLKQKNIYIIDIVYDKNLLFDKNKNDNIKIFRVDKDFSEY